MPTPALPQAPATAPQATGITTGSGTTALPQNISRPMTLEDVQLLQNRRSELSLQLNSATGRRSEVVREIGRSPDGRQGLEARLKVLDDRIVQLEKDISQNGQLLAQAPPNLVQETTPAPVFPSSGRPVNVTGISIAFIIAVLFPLTVAWSLRMLYRLRRAPLPSLTADDSQRLSRIETAVESIAVEVERISEGQRFVTKLMSESRQLGAGAAEPIVMARGERVPLERKDSA